MNNELDTMLADKMELHCRQQLSAMLDGALAPDEARFLLRRLQHDHELAGCWERWQLCGDMMRGSVPAILPSDFAQRVSAALVSGEGNGVAAVTSRRSSAPRWTRWAGGTALAASVAMAALWVGQRDPAAIQAPDAMVAQATHSTPAQAAALPVEDLQTPAHPALPDQAAGVTATAVAAAAVPRRNARRARQQGSTREYTPQTAVTHVAATDQFARLDAPARIAPSTNRPEDVRALFVGEVIAPTRPWPRAVLPGSVNDTLNAGYRLGGGQQHSGFAPFEPQTPVGSLQQP